MHGMDRGDGPVGQYLVFGHQPAVQAARSLIAERGRFVLHGRATAA
jgi:hypothetical protein